MSKIVKGIGRAISKVVRGVVNIVKSIAKSRIGKILIGAAALYFGVPMLAGAFGGAAAGAAAGQGFLGTIGGALSGAVSGAAAGISQAWAGLTGATSLASGFSPSAAMTAGGASVVPAATAAAPMAVQAAAPNAITNAALAESAAGGVGYGASSATPGFMQGFNAAAGAAKPGLISGVWESMGPYGKAAAISTGGQLIGGAMQAYGMSQEQKRQERLADEQLRTYNTNVGTRLWG